ncbi:ABC transporter permease [Lacticaseibacillus absianus]|uniref:ABC transporter permease n=1 Tax=Lacticaseibacillus absianus TaxID=2729623 RepID=UPI0015CBF573|nr:ABC transporter permease [Lacticaseibacillus absianus]
MNEVTLPRNLRWLRWLRGGLRRAGVDFNQFALIVAAKFQLAARSTNGFGLSGRRKKPTDVTHALATTFLVNLLIGGVVALLLLVPLPLLTQLTFFDTLLFFMFFMQMLSNYSSLILDPRDRRIFSVRGVADKTLNAARLAVVGYFLFVTLAALALPSLGVLLLQHGPLVVLGAALGSLLLALFAFVLSLFLYLLVLRYFDGERLKNGLNVIQIGLAMLMMLGGQLPNLLNAANINLNLDMTTSLQWWYVPAVPVWFAGPALLLGGQALPLASMLTGLALVVTALLLWAYARRAAAFEQYLDKLEQSSDKHQRQSGWFKLTRRVLTATPEEATYYTLGWRMLQSERDYKLRVYPQLAYGVILPGIMALSLIRDLPLRQAGPFLSYLGVGLIIGLATAVFNLAFSAHPEAMTLFRYVPFPTHGLLLRGVVMAMTAKLVYPFILLIALVTLPFNGAHALTAGLLVAMLCTLCSLLYGRILVGRQLPFTKQFTGDKGAQGGAIGCVTAGVSFILIALIVLAGGFLNSYWYDMGLLLASGLATWLTWRSYPQAIHYELTL